MLKLNLPQAPLPPSFHNLFWLQAGVDASHTSQHPNTQRSPLCLFPFWYPYILPPPPTSSLHLRLSSRRAKMKAPIIWSDTRNYVHGDPVSMYISYCTHWRWERFAQLPASRKARWHTLYKSCSRRCSWEFVWSCLQSISDAMYNGMQCVKMLATVKGLPESKHSTSRSMGRKEGLAWITIATLFSTEVLRPFP